MNTLSVNELNTEQRSRMAKVGLKLFFTLAEQWGLKQSEQLMLLGLDSRTTLNSWKTKASNETGVKLSKDALERLSLIAGIRKAVEMLLPRSRWVDYMRSANSDLGGLTPLDVMLTGRMEALYKVRRYLDASRGAHFG